MRRMKILPYRRIIIKTKLIKAKAIERLRIGTFEHTPSPGYIWGSMDFISKIDGANFIANRILDYRGNAFLPILHGKFLQDSGVTEIHVRMYPPIINMVLATVLVGTPLWFFGREVFEWLRNGTSIGTTFIVLMMPVFIYILMMISFNPEANQAENFLRNLYKDQ
jgi:hypothetical protein